MSFNTDKLIVFSAPSGSGKTTIVRHLLEQTDLPLAFSISATTRAPRGTEKDGEDYYFLSPEAFKSKIEKGEFLEYEEVYPGLFYGTLASEVKRLWNEKKAVLFDIDVMGGMSIKKSFPAETLTVFIQPPSIKTLEKRLRSRNTDTEETLQIRLSKAQQELDQAQTFDEIVINDDLATALSQTKELVRSFLAK
ncbi:MAG: guanylate kinase [Flavobacteriaceae bacterium]|jgi:guanylate kinase|nr:guanylate kinase [Flavobacteriaceae bacterium]